jgi:hypothetical protein
VLLQLSFSFVSSAERTLAEARGVFLDAADAPPTQYVTIQSIFLDANDDRSVSELREKMAPSSKDYCQSSAVFVLLLNATNLVTFFETAEVAGLLTGERAGLLNFVILEFARGKVLDNIPRDDKPETMARAHGAIVISPFAFDTNITVILDECSAKTELCAAFRDSPNVGAGLYAYDAVTTFANAAAELLAPVGGVAATKAVLNTKSVVDAMRRQKFDGFTGSVSFDADTGDRLALVDVGNVKLQQVFRIGQWSQVS